MLPGKITSVRPTGPMLFIADVLESTLAHAQLVALASHLRRAGHGVIIQTPGGTLARDAERLGVRIVRTALPGTTGWSRWHAMKRLRALIKSEGINLVIGVGVGPLSLLASLSDVPVSRMVMLMESLPDGEFITRYVQALKGQADFIVAGQAAARDLSTRFGVSGPTVHAIQPGIDTALFDPQAVQTERLLTTVNAWRLPEDKAVIVHALPFADEAGHRLFLEAAALLPRRDWHAVLMEGRTLRRDQREKLEEKIVALNLQHNVVIADRCTDWPAGLWLADLVVSAGTGPQLYTLPLLAAQAMGRSAIATYPAQRDEAALAGQVTMSAMFPAPLAVAMQNALAMQHVERHTVAAAARQLVRERFPFPAWVAAMRALIEARKNLAYFQMAA